MDGLTGLLDRAGCLRETERLLAESQISGQTLTVIWVGLDRFREINSAFGHAQGDYVLLCVAQRLRNHLKGDGILARLAGDEFAILLPRYDLFAAQALGEALVRGLALPLSVGNLSIRPSCSIGIALMNPLEPPAKLLERADLAMLAAKNSGGQQCVVSSSEIRHPLSDRPNRLLEELNVEALLHEAIETGGLSLHFQPLVKAGSGRLDGLEALMRCQVGNKAIPPYQFIPVAEKTGLIVRLGHWCLMEAAQLVERLLYAGHEIRVAINVSRAQLIAPGFRQTLHAALACANIPPHLLELELTESLFMDMSDNVRGNLEAARAAGFSLAIDDFGTGYSCLAYLKDLPADKIKLDRAFVCGLPDDTKSLAIVRLVTQLAQDFGLKVVAEGVETPAQYECLCQAGVHTIQGFLFSRPLPEESLIKWIKEHEQE
jgi:diguanylate cyclase (GGDEF)-like protein